MSLSDDTRREERRIHLLEYVADLETKPQFTIINSIFTTCTPEQAVQSLVTHTAPFVYTDSLGNTLWDIACIVMELIERTLIEAQAPLLAFLQELQRQTVIHKDTGEIVKKDGELLWTDLPTFSYAFGDTLASLSPFYTYNQKEESNFVNMHAFFSQLSAVASHPSLDCRDAGLGVITDAFGPHGSPPEPADFIFRCASMWFIHQAQGLWAEDTTRPWTRENWTHWKNGIKKRIAQGGDVETVELLKKALVEVERVEKE